MIVAIATGISGLLIAGVVIGARALEARSWRRSLVTYQLTWPRTVTSEQLTEAFTALAAITHRPNWSLLPLPPVALETVSTSEGITHLLRVSQQNRTAVLASLQVPERRQRFGRERRS